MPPHRQPSSSDLNYTGNSRIFVVDCKTFDDMDPQIIHKIFQDRHILVTGVEPGKRVDFNARGLSMLAPLDQAVSIQRTSVFFLMSLWTRTHLRVHAQMLT